MKIKLKVQTFRGAKKRTPWYFLNLSRLIIYVTFGSFF